jgi:hypothetical protein|eukprot:scaffold693_cov200-Alexandrium_tamarense.AAC.110
MTSGFSTAASWLQHISGQNPNASDLSTKKDVANDPILRDLRAMKDTEVQEGLFSHPPPKKNLRNENHNMMAQQQPKPKFVAHKDPTKGRKGKSKVQSNRLGNELHMA